MWLATFQWWGWMQKNGVKCTKNPYGAKCKIEPMNGLLARSRRTSFVMFQQHAERFMANHVFQTF
jgi:hypothetical protein